ncbi:MAG TPA: TolC family protein [Vicinamibacterales bacterium]|jgi:outer membrane protein TolC
MKAYVKFFGVIALLAAASPSAAQTNAPAGQAAARSFQLNALQHAAIETDPRFRKLALEQSKTALELENISADWRPAIQATALGQYQSDVPTPPPFIPGGQPLFLPPKSTVDAYVRVDQRIFDPTIGSRAAVERATLDENQARVRTELFALRQQVSDAFFTAALLQERSSALRATIDDFEARLADAQARVREGAALPSDAAIVEAALLQRQQDQEQLRVDRTSALARLADLTGQSIGADDVLEVPDLRASVVEATRAAAPARARPEYEQFSRMQERLARQQDAATAQDRPRLSAFARGGLGRPGLNFISDEFEVYGLAGVQLQWRIWNWGSTGREREALGIQQQIVAADEAAFSKSIRLSTDTDHATIDRLQRTVSLDDRIVSLREDIARVAELKFHEGAITSSDYVERSTELLQARFARSGHRVELAQANARLLTTLGLETR